MYILQEKLNCDFNDLYSHNDYNYLVAMMKIFQEKYKDRKYRIVEVIEIV